MAFPDADALLPISKAIRQKLRSEIKRTGLTAIMLLQGADDLPEGLTVAHVNRWISGIVKAAPQSHIDYVLAKWASLGDNAGRIGPDGVALPKRGRRHARDAISISMTEEMRTQLRAEMARTGIGFANILDGADDAPDGLNSRIIRGWLYGDVQTRMKATGILSSRDMPRCPTGYLFQGRSKNHARREICTLRHRNDILDLLAFALWLRAKIIGADGE